MTVSPFVTKIFRGNHGNIILKQQYMIPFHHCRHFAKYNYFPNDVPALKRLGKVSLTGFIGGGVGALCGVGGGVVMIPFLRLITTLTAHQIAATSLIAVVTGASFAAYSYSQHDIIRIPVGLSMAICGMMFSGFGAIIARKISSRMLTGITSLILYGCCIPIWHNTKNIKDKNGDNINGNKTASLDYNTIQLHRKEEEIFWNKPYIWLKDNYKFCLIGGLAGFASGLIGIGGGIVTTTFLSGFTEFTQHEAIATSLFTMLPSSLVGLAVHIRNKQVSLVVGIPLAIMCGIGMIASSNIAIGIKDEYLRKGFVLFLLGSSTLMLKDVIFT